jgi:hypothetical protein
LDSTRQDIADRMTSNEGSEALRHIARILHVQGVRNGIAAAADSS